jgi:EmrB/QacA subfamily drug resistance transporter
MSSMSWLLTEPRRPPRVRSSARAPWFVVATVCIGAFMGQLDASIVTLALPHLAGELHASAGAVEWVALAYLLVLVAALPLVGRLADAVGRKLLYVYGFAVFTAGSALCGVAPTLGVLIAARVLQGVGAAMLQANSVALIAEALPRPLLARGLGVQGTAQALGLALGPAIGGVLLALGGWRLIFLVNIPAGLAGIALGWVLLPRSRSRRAIVRPDALGAALLTVAVGAPLAFLSLGHWPLLLCGALAAALFVGRERRARDPLIDLALFGDRALSRGLGAALVAFLVLFGAMFVVPYDLAAHHVPAALIGLQVSVLPLAIAVAAPLSGRRAARRGRLLTGGGMLAAGAGLALAAAGPLVAGLALTGLGIGAFTPVNNASVMGASPPGHAGVVSGVLNMTRGIGTALGVAIGTVLYTGAGLTAALGTLAAIAVGAGLIICRD